MESWGAFAYLWQVCRFIGLHPPKRNCSWHKFYIVFGILLNCVTNVVSPLFVIINSAYARNIFDLCEIIYIFTADIFCSVKILNFWLMRREVKYTHKLFARLDQRLTTSVDRKIVTNGSRVCHLTMRVVLVMYVFTSMSSVPLKLVSNERELPFSMWFPWDWRATQASYVSTYCLQQISFMCRATQVAVCDVYPLLYLNMIAIHFRALGVRIRQVGQRSSNKSALVNETEAYADLSGCIQDYHTILKLFNTMYGVIVAPCTFQFCCTAVSLCTLGLVLMAVKVELGKLIFLLAVTCAIGMQTFINCYAADLVYEASEQLAIDIYFCDWIDQPQKFRKTLKMFLSRTQKNCVILAAKIMPVRLTTFIAVLRASYTLLTLLRSLSLDD